MPNSDKKLAILYLLDILKEYTDEKHSLTYAEINHKFQTKYGIDLDAKTIAKYITLLQDYGCDIKKKREQWLFFN